MQKSDSRRWRDQSSQLFFSHASPPWTDRLTAAAAIWPGKWWVADERIAILTQRLYTTADKLVNVGVIRLQR